MSNSVEDGVPNMQHKFPNIVLILVVSFITLITQAHICMPEHFYCILKWIVHVLNDYGGNI